MEKEWLSNLISESKRVGVPVTITVSIIRNNEENENIKYILSNGFKIVDVFFDDFTPDYEVICFELIQ